MPPTWVRVECVGCLWEFVHPIQFSEEFEGSKHTATMGIEALVLTERFSFLAVFQACWGVSDFAMSLVGIAMEAQSVRVRVDILDIRDLVTGEVRLKPLLPELVLAFMEFGAHKEAAAGDAKLRGSLSGGQRPLAKGFENIANERAGVTVTE